MSERDITELKLQAATPQVEAAQFADFTNQVKREALNRRLKLYQQMKATTIARLEPLDPLTAFRVSMEARRSFR